MLANACDGQSQAARFTVVDAQPVPRAYGDVQWRLLVKPEDKSLNRCFKRSFFEGGPRIRLSWWQRAVDAQQQSELSQGDSIKALIKLRRPYSQLNPGGFDYVAWLWRQDIQATGYIKQLIEREPQAGAAAQAMSEGLAAASPLKRRLNIVLADHPARPVIKTLMLGDRSELSAALWRQARETGIAHLLAISGLHLGLLVAAITGLTFLLSKPVTLQSGWSRFWLLLPAVLAAFMYAAIAGWPLSAQRALLMLIVGWVALGLFWRVPLFFAWSAALALVLLWQPLSVLDGGFYLSFAAVGLLLWVGFEAQSRRHNEQTTTRYWPRWIRLAVKTQWALLLGLLPLQLWLFGGFSLLSLPLNLLVVPLFGVLLMPALLLVAVLLLIGMPGAEAALLWLADGLALAMEGLAFLHQAVAGGPLGWQVLGRPSYVANLVLISGVIVLLLPSALGLRGLSIILLLLGGWLVSLPNPALNGPGRFQITAFDVGQGTALLIETQQHRLLYDTGPRWASGNSAMQAMVLPALGLMGVDTLDKIVISHDDNDHAGGLPSATDRYPGAALLGVPAQPCNAGQQWEWDGVQFTVLSPLVGLNNSNNQSCVIKVSSRYGAALLTGDIAQAIEKRLLQQHVLDVDWLLVPHHGSKTSSQQSFINAVSADTAVITSGYKNRYRLPAPEVLDRYRQSDASIRLLNTATEGAITSIFSPDCRPCNQTQKQQRRWWQRLDESH